MDMKRHPKSCLPTPFQRDLLACVEGGLPLVSAPYAQIAARLGVSEETVIDELRDLLDSGVIKRLGVVVRHRELGYRANAMVVWDLPDAEVAVIGRQLGDDPVVRLCYQRPRRLPEWPYNLFTMVHGRDRAAVLEEVQRLAARHGLDRVPHEVLFSRRRFKQRGARYATVSPGSRSEPMDRMQPEQLERA